MWCQLVVVLGLVASTTPLSLSSPLWLKNAPTTLASLVTSASAPSSISQGQTSHIFSFRRRQQKAEQLQSEKLQAEGDATDVAGSDASGETGSEADNEASPTLLQKKLGKILAKIRFLSSLTGGTNGNEDGSGVEEGVNASNNTTSNATTTDVLGSDPDGIDNNVTPSDDNATERAHTFQKIIYPHSKYGAPLKLSYDVNEKIVNEPTPEEGHAESQNIQTVPQDMGKLSQIGVFFAEVVGSIVGLIYGAAAQITSGSDGAKHLE